MPTAYPAALDNFNNPTAADDLNDAPVLHSAQHTNVNDAVKAIETELGLLPKGASATVRARLDAIDVAVGNRILTSAAGAALGVATLNGSSMLSQNVDAGKITTGSVAVARIPNLSGAKILGTGGGGAPIPVDAVPDLPASKTTSGTFAVARIPGLPGTQITSGTVDAARLPSSVTANANSRVVADVAAMNAIPVPERVNGMIVTVLSPWTQYTWRSDNSTWNQSGGPGAVSEPPTEVYDGTPLTSSVITFNAGAPGQSITFTAPKSGKIWVILGSLVIITVGTGQGYFSAEVRQGNVVGSGTVVNAAATTNSVAVGGATGLRSGGSVKYLVEGLTAGNQYHVRTMFTTSSSPTATMQMFYRRLAIEMVH